MDHFDLYYGIDSSGAIFGIRLSYGGLESPTYLYVGWSFIHLQSKLYLFSINSLLKIYIFIYIFKDQYLGIS
jgi:hypothetical protein